MIVIYIGTVLFLFFFFKEYLKVKLSLKLTGLIRAQKTDLSLCFKMEFKKQKKNEDGVRYYILCPKFTRQKKLLSTSKLLVDVL